MTLSQHIVEIYTTGLCKRIDEKAETEADCAVIQIALPPTCHMIIHDVRVNFGDNDADKVTNYLKELFPNVLK